jgi:hypothetical protein
MLEFTDGYGSADRGWDRFWIILNLPGRLGLGSMFNGLDWKGPISVSSSSLVNGPMYLPLRNSDDTTELKMFACAYVLGLLGGVKV